MALVLHLKYAENLRGKADRLAKVSFRGVSHYSKVVENASENVWFDETFEWPVARPIESDEYIDIHIFNYNKYLSNRLVGLFRMILQEVIEVGHIKICDSLIDANNTLMKTTVTFELSYNAPDGSVGMWQKGGFEQLKSDDLRGGLSEEERNQLNLEKRTFSESDTLSSHSKSMRDSKLSINSRSSGNKSPNRFGYAVRKMMAVKNVMSEKTEDKVSLIEDNEADADLDARATEIGSMLARAGMEQGLEDDTVSQTSGPGTPIAMRKSKAKHGLDDPIMKSQDFQVCITILEARQLAGLNMDPVVCVQIGDHKKYTSVKESTNCPYYSEYFVFDFHMPPAMLFDKIITLTVLQSGRFFRSNRPLGSYKLDIATVYSAQDHQFYHKWAMLTDPDDINGGLKGYLKCDIAVIGKGDSVKVPIRTDKDDDDIEGNLLLPEGVPADRQKAKFSIKIYRAEGLPKMNSGVMASVKKALTGEKKDLVDPYVKVTFAGHVGKTTVAKGAYEPVWNEQIVFTEMFPPLCRRLKVQLLDNDSINDDLIGTHFLDIHQISNEGEKGFLPTFGPSWVNLYGSTRYYSIRDEHTHLNDGLGEGVSYRGRLLVALKVDLLDSSLDITSTTVETETCLPVPDIAAGKPDEYFLFCTFLEASMINKRIADKPIHFEISCGNAGNILDGYNPPSRRKSTSSSDESEVDEEETISEGEDADVCADTAPKWQSTTAALKPVTRDKVYYHLPYYQNKQCVYVRNYFEDHRRRMYNTNIINKIIEKLEFGINSVQEMLQQEQPFPEKRLRFVFEEFGSSCSKFVSIVKSSGGNLAGKTKLDKERHQLLVREMDHFSTLARTVKAMVNKNNIKEKMKLASQYLEKLRLLAVEPQHSLPDIFIWMISGNKRLAYHRVYARDIIHSVVDEERGKDCGKVLTLLLKLPGKKATGQSGWTIQAKLQVYLWLGLSKHKKDYLKGLPKGYEESKMLSNSCKPHCVPPNVIHYPEKQTFQLRCHMFQARSLIGSDASGLSDPFAVIVFGDQSVCTQVIEETLSPTWDEMLIINEVIMYGVMEDILDDPPVIIIEIFDQDKVGKSEFIGRALCKPVVKLSTESYESPKFPPRLEWWDILRGSDRAGELLSAFELLQLARFGDKAGQDLPPMEMPDQMDVNRGPITPVPKGIRPILSKHRIEVLFWGVRDLKKVQFQAVNQPRIDIECAGHVLQSSVILSTKKNPNFSIPVKYFDVELPQNELYCPPITIRCVDCRNFGRDVLVGTHIINSMHKFMFVPTTKTAKNLLQKLFPGKGIENTKQIKVDSSISTKSEDVVVTLEEKSPLIQKEQTITIETGGKILKNWENQKKKKDTIDEEEPDEDCMDWWSKYFVSLENMIKAPDTPVKEYEKNRGNCPELEDIPSVNTQKSDTPYGSIPNGQPNSQDDSECDAEEVKKLEKELKKIEQAKDHSDKKTLKGTARAVNLVSKLSPKAQRKKEKKSQLTAKLKDELQSNIHVVAKHKVGYSWPIQGFVNYAFQAMFEGEEDSDEEGDLGTPLLKLYPNELESQKEYDGFKDWLDTFELFRGKNYGEEESDEGRIVGKFKGSLRIYKIPLPPDIEDTTISGGDPQYGLFHGLPGNEPIKVLVRVYIVKGNDLHPADMNGKADPYLVIRLGSTVINDKENYISKQLNPVFGKCFSIEATFPMESMLSVQIFDWDLVGRDDLIGETKIDLENRYYSRHKGTCGIAQKYDVDGYNCWRDPQKPTQILAKLCKDTKTDGPHFQPGKVRVGNRIFTAPTDNSNDSGLRNSDEILALAALNHWEEIPKVGCKLVPEHVETRPLYNPEKPGIEQGKVEMWVDMFPMDMPPPGPPVDISPRKPKSYELRCIIWNTDDVVLEDDAFFTGEKMSDIYVKGWIKGQEDMQSTDIHYRSLTGEGNFNWRFVFPFDYLVAEEKIVISRKESLFSWDETETKIPARLNLQVWDADHFSADDFLGSLTLDMNRFPRGAKSSKQCTLNMMKTDGNVPMMSLFKHKRVKGWWPFAVKNENDDLPELTGKVEAELHLMTAEEAEKHPAGLGRNEPDPLDKPNRPDSSFMWFLNPLKSIRYIIWHNYKWVILKIFIVLLLAALLVLFFYSMPGYTVKKMFGA